MSMIQRMCRLSAWLPQRGLYREAPPELTAGNRGPATSPGLGDRTRPRPGAIGPTAQCASRERGVRLADCRRLRRKTRYAQHAWQPLLGHQRKGAAVEAVAAAVEAIVAGAAAAATTPGAAAAAAVAAAASRTPLAAESAGRGTYRGILRHHHLPRGALRWTTRSPQMRRPSVENTGAISGAT